MMLNSERDAETKRIQKLGGATVALMEHLSPEEYMAISFLRRWCDGTTSRISLRKELVINLGYGSGEQTIQSFSELCEIIFKYGRRHLIRHKTNCDCVGADESCFAQLITRAVYEEKEDTMLIALLLVPPAFTAQVVDLSLKVGIAVRSLVNKESKLMLDILN